MKINVYSHEQQGYGEFDGKKITEQKPIGFPGEGSEVKRVGPLFYWAWFFAKKEGFIPSHPHQAFEIITYVIHGIAEHGDSLGIKSKINAGGAQVMQTGSGVQHQEKFIGPDMEGFQIWLEPSIKEAVGRAPAYFEYEQDAFPVKEENGVTTKTVIGEGAPIQLETDVKMWDISIEGNGSTSIPTADGYSLCILAVRGDGEWQLNQSTVPFNKKDFTVIESTTNINAVVHNRSKFELLQIFCIEVPTEVDYPLYPKR
ncbi:pirin family protein [Chengkuizengella sediminis]|uniref:pirin family protein n=1 Tax=Chengkuizengella sediminis TaxID=1885917 RepID=UPI001389D8E1|nr:pirin [Chengkuizengella sediminis]